MKRIREYKIIDKKVDGDYIKAIKAGCYIYIAKNQTHMVTTDRPRLKTRNYLDKHLGSRTDIFEVQEKCDELEEEIVFWRGEGGIMSFKKEFIVQEIVPKKKATPKKPKKKDKAQDFNIHEVI